MYYFVILQDAVTAVFEDIEHPALSRNKNFENFKRRCKYHGCMCEQRLIVTVESP